MLSAPLGISAQWGPLLLSSLTADDFYHSLLGLLPAGPAWGIDESVVAKQMLLAWADELERIQSAIEHLIEEADPRTTTDLLLDYERVFGLPTDCLTGVDQTFSGRRAALVSQMVSVGGQSRAYFIALAAAAGYDITITEFMPFTVNSGVSNPLAGQEWIYYWRVEGAGVPFVNYLTVNSGVNEPLATWATNLLFCLFNRFKPAHTQVIFS